MKNITLTAAAALALGVLGGTAAARDQIQIVGSSTVFPFSTAVAERFGQQGGFDTPVVESTGTGGGMKLFCAGVGESTPDITNASRRIKEAELKACTSQGVTPVEVKIGFDGIVLANARQGPQIELTRDHIFQALSGQLPGDDGTLQPNPNRNWSDIDPSLPDSRIEVLGPPPTSGTYDAFIELVMEESCPAGMEVAVCRELRQDGAYIEAGENDNLIVQKLQGNPAAVGIFGFSYLDQNASVIRGVHVDGVEPTFENIASGEYPVSRPLFFYIKKEHAEIVPGLKDYALEFTSPDAIGDDGYLADKGLIPLPGAEQEQSRRAVEEMIPLQM